jgi:hypothetical protein
LTPAGRPVRDFVPARLRALDTSPWLPLAIAAVLLVALAVVDLVLPNSVRGTAVLATAAVLIIAAYIVWPKPSLLVFALFVLFYHTLGRWLSPDLRHIDEIVVPALFVLAALRMRPWRRGLIDPLREGALLVMLVAGIGSSVVNSVPASVWTLGLLLLVKVFAFLYVVLWHDFESRDVRQLYPLVLAIGVVVLSLVPFELLNPTAFHRTLNLTQFGVPRDGLPSVTSIFYHPMLLAWFCAFVGLYLIAGYVVLRRRVLLIAAALFAVGTVLAGRRRAILGVAAALFGGVVQSFAGTRSWRLTARAWWPAAAGAVLVAAAFLPSLLGLANLTLDPGSQPGVSSPDARTSLYSTSVLVARDYFPFGAGLGRYGSGVSRDPYSPVYARYGLDKIDGLSPQHSSFVSDTFWPRILGETGIVGLVALIVFTLVVTRQVWRAARAPTTDGMTRAFLLGTWMIFVQALVETLASSLFDSPPRIYLLFGAVAVALSLSRRLTASPDETAPAESRPRPADAR